MLIENKRGLLLAAFDQYRQDRDIEFQPFFDGSQPILSALKISLDIIVSECLSCNIAKACLLTKALNEIAGQDEEVRSIIISRLSDWQPSLAELFVQAKTKPVLMILT